MTRAAEQLEAAWEATDAMQEFQLYQEAARLADLDNDQEVARTARDGLLDSARLVGDSATLLGTFAWLLADADREHPDETPLDLLWRYKWAISAARGFSRVPLERLHELLEDFTRRTRAAGLGERTALMYHWRLELHRGDLVAAATRRQEIQNLKRTVLDCAACDHDTQVMHHLQCGELDEAMKAARPLLTGKVSCNRAPSGTFAELLLPLHRAGRTAEAQAFHERGYALVEDDLDALSVQALHLAYLLDSGQVSQAARLYHQHQAHANPADDVDRFWWHAANAHPANRHSDPPAHHAQAVTLARQLDQRNGTTAYQQRLADLIGQDVAHPPTPA